MTAKKNNKKVNETLKDHELNKVTGGRNVGLEKPKKGMDDYPAKKKGDSPNSIFPIPLPV